MKTETFNTSSVKTQKEGILFSCHIALPVISNSLMIAAELYASWEFLICSDSFTKPETCSDVMVADNFVRSTSETVSNGNRLLKSFPLQTFKINKSLFQVKISHHRPSGDASMMSHEAMSHLTGC